MPWNDPTTQSLRDRQLADLHQQEVKGDSAARSEMTEMNKLLEDLANRLQSERMDQLRKIDSTIPTGWSAQQWRKFWELYDPLWSGNTESSLANQARLTRMENDLLHLKQINDALEKRLTHSHTVCAALEKQLMQLRILEKQNQQERIHKNDTALPPHYRDTVLAARAILVPMPTDKFSKELLNPPQRWQRKFRILYVIAHTGWACRLELDYVLSQIESVSARGSAIKRVIADLTNTGYLELLSASHVHQGSAITLILVRLTAKGNMVCKEFGWEVVSSEWEDLQQESIFFEKFDQLQQRKIFSFTSA